jgi:hypothetical protein
LASVGAEVNASGGKAQGVVSAANRRFTRSFRFVWLAAVDGIVELPRLLRSIGIELV